MPKYHDLAIRGSDKKSLIGRLIKAGGVSVYCRPQYLRSGKWVAIVTQGNRIQLMFKATAIEGPYKLKLSNGNTGQHRYFIKADKRSMQQPKPAILSPIKGWFAIGAFRYFNKATMKSKIVGETFGRRGKYIDNGTREVSGIRVEPHTKGIPGMPHGHPESILVDEYVEWMGEGIHFGHRPLRGVRLIVDLFDLTHWQLLEAKVSTSRETIRMAIGQLRDYKRYYNRPPSLAVLLPSRPSADCVKLLTDNRIAVIWKNLTGSFSTKRWQD
jgi:hypothetical protein